MRIKLDLSDLQRTIHRETAKKRERYLNKKRYKKLSDKVKTNFKAKKLK